MRHETSDRMPGQLADQDSKLAGREGRSDLASPGEGLNLPSEGVRLAGVMDAWQFCQLAPISTGANAVTIMPF